ncbi:MAG: hypothetical protein PVG39_01340 [Desulfobacteraceae bacterium]
MSKRVGATLSDRDNAWLEYSAQRDRVRKSTYIRKAILEKINKKVNRETQENEWPLGYPNPSENA